jgi:intracellular sulfur oxidation DsrE/DsrF family protein
MKKFIFLPAIILAISVTANAQTKVFPLIKSYGAVWAIPGADHKPDPKLDYKILVELTDNATKPDTLNVFLEAVATLINMHAVEGVPKEKIHVAVVLRKMATTAVYSNEKYNEKYKTDNPNLQLIKELSEAGVEFYVCGQTMIRGKMDKSQLVPEAKVASAGLTTMTTLQLQGYSYIKF